MSQQINNLSVLVIDNYDSFTYNLVHLVKSLGVPNVKVVRNDCFEFDLLENYSKIILSPGPGLPKEAGKMPQLVQDYGAHKSILGVCLGHQCIAEIFGANLHNLTNVVHGKATNCKIIKSEDSLFEGLEANIEVGRYHSWVVSNENFPNCLEITAVDDQGQIMALAHKEFDLKGVQFHPESVLTPCGAQIIKNWLES